MVRALAQATFGSSIQHSGSIERNRNRQGVIISQIPHNRLPPDTGSKRLTAPPARAIDAFAGNTLAGIRLAFAAPVRPGDIVCNRTQLLATAIVVAAVILLAERLAAGAGSLPWTWGVSSLTARAAAWVVVLALTAMLATRDGDPWFVVLGVILGWLPAAATIGVLRALATTFAIEPNAGSGQLAFAAALLWHAAVVWRVLALLPRPVWRRHMAAVAVYLLGVGVVLRLLPAAPVFYQPQPGTAAAIDVESVYYRQPALLDAQLGRLPPQRAGEIDIYFLTYAPYGEEDVFLREARSATAIADRALALDERHLSLINHRSLVERTALANRPNLAAAVRRIGEVMDRNEDMLFIFITSHGGDGAVAAALDPIAPNDLYADDLRALLDSAGIRWRIVVVSACYSGSFIEPLAADSTLVITASAADRPSFGCEHENQWTYFGEAYFAAGLEQTGDPVAAFTRARDLVEQREDDEGLPFSQPQMALGSAIGDYLEQWRSERGLD